LQHLIKFLKFTQDEWDDLLLRITIIFEDVQRILKHVALLKQVFFRKQYLDAPSFSESILNRIQGNLF
jgi:hypothetical protein